MRIKPDLPKKPGVGLTDLARCSSRVHTQKKRDKPLDNCSIRSSVKNHFALAILGGEMNHRLTTSKKMLIAPVFRGKIGQLTAHIDDLFVAVFPVVKKFELFDDIPGGLLRAIHVFAPCPCANVMPDLRARRNAPVATAAPPACLAGGLDIAPPRQKVKKTLGGID